MSRFTKSPSQSPLIKGDVPPDGGTEESFTDYTIPCPALRPQPALDPPTLKLRQVDVARFTLYDMSV